MFLYFCFICIVPIFLAAIVAVGARALSIGLLNLQQKPHEIQFSRLLLWGVGITGAAILFAYWMGTNVRGASYGIQFPIHYVFAEIAGGVLGGIAIIVTERMDGLKVAGLPMFVFPAALLLIYWLGVEFAGDAVFRCDLPLYAQAVDAYYQDAAKFPDKIDSTWVQSPIRPRPCPWHAGTLGLLYTHDEVRFVIGGYHRAEPGSFDHTPLSDLLGPRVCLYDSRVAKVGCGFRMWGPFTPPDQAENEHG